MYKDSPGDQASRGTFHLFVLSLKPLIPHCIHHIQSAFGDSYNRGSRDRANSLSGWQGSQSAALFYPTIPNVLLLLHFIPLKYNLFSKHLKNILLFKFSPSHYYNCLYDSVLSFLMISF